MQLFSYQLEDIRKSFGRVTSSISLTKALLGYFGNYFGAQRKSKDNTIIEDASGFTFNAEFGSLYTPSYKLTHRSLRSESLP
jgi:hypothetical protein